MEFPPTIIKHKSDSSTSYEESVRRRDMEYPAPNAYRRVVIAEGQVSLQALINRLVTMAQL